MAWALVNTEPKNLMLDVWTPQENPMAPPIFSREEVEVKIGTICNLIVYDGVSKYTPAEGYKLVEVPDDAKMGDNGY